jgi:hypothetical protein
MQRNQLFKHQQLYGFWSRSEGLWHSKMVNISIRILTAPELLTVAQIHHLESPEFGIKMSWEHNTNHESGQMLWCVDADHPGAVFTDKGIQSDDPSVYHYQLVSQDILITIDGKAEETNILEPLNHRRLRELRYNGKLIRRHWENKFVA